MTGPDTGAAPGPTAGRGGPEEEVTVQDPTEVREDESVQEPQAAAEGVTVEGAPADGDQAPDAAAGGVPTTGSDGAAEAPTDQDPELTQLRTELEERTADLKRVSAEYANYRRRVERDREATINGAKAQVAGELLTVLDDVERAGTHGDLTGPFKVVADRLTETLTRAGLAGFGEVGDAFDPSVHEAVAHGTSAEVDGPTVTTVMRRGYRFGEKVLRPAMVEVTDHDPDAVPAGTGSAGGGESA
ncbi:nucleotide exchange factor GrpE [Actinomycetospora endophytica]|uniref:Protein GrpE n=1 Tax=Actinomycetospora endophytica TaxID=2291215 RepID=A0ABS8P3W1_9PSEU|nr:nucleotide exchange factor GrpE [Actinomycetospora endophytica]MCD2192945.1 nucleotide exchange factor GrpE [Actinomycetospora endophytica]